MPSRCWIILVVLSTLAALASTQSWRGGFRRGRGSSSDSGSDSGSEDRTDGVCMNVYSAYCSSKSPAQPTGQRRWRGNPFVALPALILKCFDACKADDLCLVNATLAAPPKRMRLAQLSQFCPFCFTGCPSGTICTEDFSYCAMNPDNAVCKWSTSQMTYNTTLSTCLSDTIFTTISPTVAMTPVPPPNGTDFPPPNGTAVAPPA